MSLESVDAAVVASVFCLGIGILLLLLLTAGLVAVLVVMDGLGCRIQKDGGD